jgi:hypothetical protein
MSVVDSKLARNADDGFDDVISGKGQGCNILLQYNALLQSNQSLLIYPQRSTWRWEDFYG